MGYIEIEVYIRGHRARLDQTLGSRLKIHLCSTVFVLRKRLLNRLFYGFGGEKNDYF